MRSRTRQKIGLGAVLCASAVSFSVCLASTSSAELLVPKVFGIPLAGEVIEAELPERAYPDRMPAKELEIPEVTTEAAAPAAKIRSLDLGDEDAYLLAKIAMAEAEGEDTAGKALVILVVLNRVWDDSFPDDIRSVIYQKGQFSPVSNGRFDSVEPDADCWAAVDMVVTDWWDESRGALYFESESASTWHRDNLEFLFQHGAHLFYADKEE